MPVDPTERDESVQDATETARNDEETVEAPEADAFEQRREVTPPPEDAAPEEGPDATPATDPRDPLTAAADEADRAEQARVVELDEDEYR